MSARERAFDAVVVGLGAMGSSALCHLARRGLRVLGLDRFSVPNAMGSSHGGSRIMRLAYFQDPRYVALARRACAEWRELELESGRRLFHVTGSIDAGVQGARVFEGSRRSCVAEGLAHEVLDAAAVRARWPGYELPEGMMALYQPDGGFLAPERCIETYAETACSFGALVREHEPLLDWSRDGAGFSVRTAREEYRASQLVLTVGPWASRVVEGLGPHLEVERQVVGWFEPRRPEHFVPERFPVFNLEWKGAHLYGIPATGARGFKCGRHHHLHERVDPDAVRRTCDDRDERVIREHAEALFPGGMGATQALETCLYTSSPDESFVLDAVPGGAGAWVAAGFSGHGFKFASVVGAILADLVTRGSTAHDISMFRGGRFGEAKRAVAAGERAARIAGP